MAFSPWLIGESLCQEPGRRYRLEPPGDGAIGRIPDTAGGGFLRICGVEFFWVELSKGLG